MPTLSELRSRIEREMPDWLEKINLASTSRQKINDWLDGKRDRFHAAAPSWCEQVYMEEIRRYYLSRLVSTENHMPLGWSRWNIGCFPSNSAGRPMKHATAGKPHGLHS